MNFYIFSSNFNYSEFEHHLSITRDGTEKTKAARIIERIKTLSTPYYLTGKNFETIEFYSMWCIIEINLNR